jgi:acyl-CoA reductase-like NAD-dependent aldehyde dehydrogenase
MSTAPNGTVIVRENPTRPSEIVGQVAATDAAGVDAAVVRADAAQQAWRGVPAAQRAALLRAAADAAEPQLDALSVLLAREMGKPLADARGELGFSLMFARYVCDNIDAVADEWVDDGAGRMLLQRVPYGVVAAITPWNAPAILSMLKVAPALVTGNAIVVKPSPLAPLAVTALYAAMSAVLPAGLLQVVHGDAEAGAALVGHPLVRKVAFTGGNATGAAIGRTAAERITPTVMELGGNDAALFLADADLSDSAMDRIVMATFATAGQVCMASKRIYVQASRFSEFTQRFAAAADRVLVVGDPLAPGVTMGPVVSAEAQRRLLALRDASAVTGGVVIDVGTVADPAVFADGYFVRPAMVTALPDSAPLVSEEQFGPLVPIQSFDTVEEAVARANAGDLGLGASVWSSDEAAAFEVASRLEAGFRFINTHNRTGMALRAPFGGVKRSGFGREYGREGLAEYVQTCVINAPAAFRPGAAPPASPTAYPGT